MNNKLGRNLTWTIPTELLSVFYDKRTDFNFAIINCSLSDSEYINRFLVWSLYFTTHTLRSSLLFYNSYVTLELAVLQVIRYARACCFTTHTLRSSLLFYNSYVTLELTVLQLIRYARACCFHSFFLQRSSEY